MKISAQEYIEAAHVLNDAIQGELNQNKYPWEALTAAVEELAKKEGWEGWHYINGKAGEKDDVPFELFMLHLAVLSTAWVCWLYGAKARDRIASTMKDRTMEFLERFLELRLASLETIFTDWDEQARAAIVRTVTTEGNKSACVKYGLWEDLSVWAKLRVRVRSLRNGW